MSDAPLPRPENSIEGGLQHERTALAWQRTAIAMMVAGVSLGRFLARDAHAILSPLGIVQTAAGCALLIWAGANSERLHSVSRPASAVAQVALTRIVGIATLAFTGFALIASLAVVIAR